MPKNSAVIDDASETSTFESATHSNLMPTDKDYMLTGKMPAETEEQHEDEHEEESAGGEHVEAGEQDTHTPGAEGEEPPAGADSAASEAASHTQKKPGQSAGENRYQKLSRENRDLREEVARLKGKEEGRGESRSTDGNTRDARPGSQPGDQKTGDKSQPEPKPKIDDVDPKTGKAKFANYQEYEDALDKWRRNDVLREVRAETAKSDAARVQTEQERIINIEVGKRATEARKQYPDYDNTMKEVFERKDENGNVEFFYAPGSHLDGFFLESPRMSDLFYTLAKNWDKHKAIFARDAQGKYVMNPIRQVRMLSAIESSLPAKRSTSAGGSGKPNASGTSAKPSAAPRPPHQTSGTGAVSKDSRSQAVDDKDQDTYRRAANENDPRLKAYRASLAKK